MILDREKKKGGGEREIKNLQDAVVGKRDDEDRELRRLYYSSRYIKDTEPKKKKGL